jgi:integrase
MIATAQGRWRPLVVTAIFTGLRASELRGLRWDDVDLDKAELTVRQRADRWGSIGSPKSDAGKRDVPLAPIIKSGRFNIRPCGPLVWSLALLPTSRHSHP